jgi:hypothetical protein
LDLEKNEDGVSVGPRYKMFIGKGNNSLLVKSIMKRRFWWQFTHNIDDHNINFYWSQNTIDKVHEQQTSHASTIPQSSQIFRRTNRIKSKILK